MTRARITEKFAALKKENRAGLVIYLMGGDPDAETSLSLLKALPKAGADFIELGFPFSDPTADGPTIQAAGKRALEQRITLKKILKIVRQFREMDTDTPIILMGYYNPVLAYGEERFCIDAQDAGVDGLLIVDLPLEEDESLHKECKTHHLSLIKLAAPTTSPARAKQIVKHAGGFLYYVSIAGITGTKSADIQELEARVNALKEVCPLPVAVGFGVKKAEQAKAIGTFADAVVVGSAVVSVIEEHCGKDRQKMQDAVVQTVRKLANGMK